MIIPLYIAVLALVCYLARNGFTSPYISGGIGLALASYYSVGYTTAIFFIVSLYIGALMAGTKAEAQGDAVSMTALLQGATPINSRRLILCKTVFLILFIFLPVPKPPIYVTGIFALLLITSTIWHNNVREVSYARSVSVAVVIAVTFALAFHMSVRIFNITNPSLAIIAGIAIPNILFGNSNPDSEDYGIDMGFWSIIISLLFTYMTPGFSSSAVCSSVFAPGGSRTQGNAILEGATEGWVLHLILGNESSGKSPLGDIFNTNPIGWTTFTPTSSMLFTIIFAITVGMGMAWAMHIMLDAEEDIFPTYTQSYGALAVLVAQAIATAGLIPTALFVGGGCLTFLFKRWQGIEENSISTIAFISPMLF